MRGRTELIVCVVLVGLATLVSIEPRFDQLFPSLVDDWSAIAYAPDQLREILRLGAPEETRYRPGFVAWNALQWHTLGAPHELLGPQLWGVLRWLILVVGTTLLTALVTPRTSARPFNARWLLVLGVSLAVLTPPGFAVDLARFGPQEPLLVGCMGLGAVMLAAAVDRVLREQRWGRVSIVLAVAGLVVWGFGVLQKETSICVLLLAPFLTPLVRAERARWDQLDHRERLGVGLVTGGLLLPFVPMVTRTIQLALADERIYEGASEGQSFVSRLYDQLRLSDDALLTSLPLVVLGGAAVLLAVRSVRYGVDWLSTGFVVVALAFLVFSAGVGVVVSRYYLPVFVLGGLTLGRSAVALGLRPAVLTGFILVTSGILQAWDGHGWVERWVDAERDREAVVREAAALAAGGCPVSVVGVNVEFVRAVPVLMRFADESPRGCTAGERFIVVIPPRDASADAPRVDAAVTACAPDAIPAWSSGTAEILRCTA